MDRKSVEKLADMMKETNNIVFFGGAGVSTESGVKDYRSEDGIYNSVREYGVSPEVILSKSFFERNPDVFYDFYHNYFFDIKAEPNKAHIALAELEKMGKLRAVITQNIDGLHQRAGSRNVLELHGTLFDYRCHTCYKDCPEAHDIIAEGKIPRCRYCGGYVRPKIVLYEEMLNEEVIEKSLDAIQNAEMMIIGGTSLTVNPASSFVRYFRGRHLVLINRDATAYDNMANLVIRDKIGEVLSEAMKILQLRT